MTADATAPVDPTTPGRPLPVRVAARIAAHPFVVVALIAVPIALSSAIWLWANRRLGAIDPDEAGYLANALRYHRSLSFTDPFAVVMRVGGTGNGPLVPVLSVPLLLVGPRDPRTAMLIQPILAVVVALAAAGIGRRLGGPWVAIVSGIVMAGLPTTILASESYWLGLGAGACLGCAMWALLESERLTNRWAWAYGLAMTAMVMSRTMALGFLPGALLAGLVVAWGDRRRLLGLGKAVLTLLLIAGPWYLVNATSIFEYLFGYGYGPRAGLFGSGGPLDRFWFRIERIRDAARPARLLVWLLALTVVAALVGLVRRRIPMRVARGPRSDRVVGTAAVSVAFLSGFAALVSTSNNGVWFEYPLIVILVPLLATFLALAWRPLAATMAVAAVASSIYWPIRMRVDGETHYEAGFEQYDTRFSPERRSEARDAAREWWALSQDVADDLRDVTDEGQRSVVTLTGNFQLFNTNSVQLAAELDDWLPNIWVPDTTLSARRRADDLTPEARTTDGTIATNDDGEEMSRVLVVARHDQHLFTPDAEAEDFYQQAVDAGWEPVATHPIPTGGEVIILTHPEGG